MSDSDEAEKERYEGWHVDHDGHFVAPCWTEFDGEKITKAWENRIEWWAMPLEHEVVVFARLILPEWEQAVMTSRAVERKFLDAIYGGEESWLAATWPHMRYEMLKHVNNSAL